MKCLEYTTTFEGETGKITVQVESHDERGFDINVSDEDGGRVTIAAADFETIKSEVARFERVVAAANPEAA